MRKSIIIIHTVLIGTLLFSSRQVQGQYSPAGLTPNVTRPTPEAASLFKFLEYPVDYYTGIPDISIPLYELSSGQLSLPISISYHASGRKVYDETGAIGLGWTLNAGGMIARTVFGAPDDYDNKFTFPWPWKGCNDGIDKYHDYYFLAGADKRECFITNPDIPGGYHLYDTQYDIFSYTFNSNSGKFVFKDSSNIKIPVLLPKRPYKIEKHSNISGTIHYYDYLEIIDDKGVLYRFGKSITDGNEYIEISDVAKTGWLLTEIISADKSDTISFKYSTFVKIKGILIQEVGVRNYDDATYGYPQPPELVGRDGVQDEYSSTQRLTEIKFNQGKIIFNLVNGADQIGSIQVVNKNNEPIKTVEFNRSYLDSRNNLHSGEMNYKLDNVIFIDSQQKEIEKYSFEYYPTVTNIFASAQDFWGYHNNAGQDNNLVPFVPTFQSTTYQPNEYSDRNSNLSGMTCGVLKKITYPTNGSSEFIYETNKYQDYLGQQHNCGGLRIKEIITNDNNGNTQIKTYDYGLNRCGYGILVFTPSIENMTYSVAYLYQEFPGSLGGFYTERYGSCNVLAQYGFFLQNPVYYTEITEWNGTETENIGKTVYKYMYPEGSSIGRFEPNMHYNYWDKNTLTDIVTFKRRVSFGVAYYDTVKWISNTYSKTTYENERLMGLLINRGAVITPDAWFSADSQDSCLDYNNHWGPCYYYRKGNSWEQAWIYNKDYSVYRFFDYTISVGKTELTSVYEKDYSNGMVSTSKSYSYNPTYHLLTQTAQTVNNSDVLETKFKYPFDPPVSLLDQAMIDNNMLDYKVETGNYRNSIFLDGTKTVYRNWGNIVIAPDSVFWRKGALPYELLMKYHYDANGKIRQYQKINDNKTSFIWGYNNTLPIAKVVNASLDQIYYTSFEDLTGTTDGNSKTGRKICTSNYSVNLPNGLYILSYWNRISGVWTYYNSQINITTGSYTITVSNPIDELRFLPVDAQMTTFTYDPLIGMTSSTDENNVTTYYEYDTFGRLSLVKDQNGNIVKKYNYQYTNQ